VISGTKTIALYLASFEPKLLGVSNIERAEVDQWLSFANAYKAANQVKTAKSSRDFARPLNDILLHRVFFAAPFLTVADLILYANLYSYIVRDLFFLLQVFLPSTCVLIHYDPFITGGTDEKAAL